MIQEEDKYARKVIWTIIPFNQLSVTSNSRMFLVLLYAFSTATVKAKNLASARRGKESPHSAQDIASLTTRNAYSSVGQFHPVRLGTLIRQGYD